MEYHGILWESMGKEIKKLITQYKVLKKLYKLNKIVRWSISRVLSE